MKNRTIRLILIGIVIVVTLASLVFAVHQKSVHVPLDITLEAGVTFVNEGSSNRIGSQFVVLTNQGYGLLSQRGEIAKILGQHIYVRTAEGIIIGVNNESRPTYYFEGMILDSRAFSSKVDIFDRNILRKADDTDGHRGYVNMQNVWVVSPRYERLWPFSGGEDMIARGIAADENDRKFVVDANGNEYPLPHPLRGKLSENGFRDGLLRFERVQYIGEYDGVFGHKYEGGVTFLKPDGSNLYPLPGSGRDATDVPFHAARDFSEGLAAVEVDGKWGYIDTTGRYVVDCAYQIASDFENGNAVVGLPDGIIRVIDTGGNAVSEFKTEYTYGGEFHAGLISVKGPSGYGLLSVDGSVALECNALRLTWSREFWNVASNGNAIFVPECKKLISCEYVIYSNDAVIAVETEAFKTILYDRNSGKIIMQPRALSAFCEGLAVARGFGGYGYIDYSGNWVIPAQFSTADVFSDGMAYVVSGGQEGFIANPLVYDGNWGANEYERAKIFGLFTDAPDESLSGDGCLALIRQGLAFQRQLQKRSVLSCDIDFAILERELESALTAYGNGTLSREEFSSVLAILARGYGRNIQHYKSFYADSAAISPKYLHDVAYLSTLHVFDCQDSQFRPFEPVTQGEAVLVLLRFFEQMLS